VSSLLSILELCDERWTLYLTVPYFVVDGLVNIRDKEWVYLAHHVITLCGDNRFA
jgi:hypothetical protein